MRKTYPHGDDGREFMMLGRIVVEQKDGKGYEVDFAGRTELVVGSQGQPKLHPFQGWVTR